MYSLFEVEVKDCIAVVTMEHTVMKDEFASEYYDLLDELDRDDNVRAILLKNDSKFFCAGGDLKSKIVTMSPVEVKDFIHNVNKAINHVFEIRKPVIALVNGAAAGGGCNLALSCDFIIASEKALFAEAFVDINTMPDTGGLWTLVNTVGIKKAKELAMTGRRVMAEEAYELGMVDKLVSSDKLMEVGMEFAMKLASKPPRAIASIKSLCNKMPELTRGTYCELEETTMGMLKSMKDSQEGMEAFVQKRAPEFKGK